MECLARKKGRSARCRIFLPSQETQLLLRLKRFAFLLSPEQERAVSRETVVVFRAIKHTKCRSMRYCYNVQIKKPFRAILSYLLTLPSRKKAVPRDTVTFFNLKHQVRAILSSFLTLPSTKIFVPCNTLAFFIIKRPFRAILSHCLAKKSRSVRYCRYF